MQQIMGQSNDEATQAIQAEKLREMLVKLGPTYIKIGELV